MEIDTSSKALEQAMNRAFSISDFYQLLSVSLQYPTTILADGIGDKSLIEDAKTILDELECDSDVVLAIVNSFNNLEKRGPHLLRELRQEYTRLFDHPKNPVLNIYESLFLYDSSEGREEPRLFLNSAALDAQRCYLEAGVDQIDKASGPADHFAVELEFVTFLYANLGRAIQYEKDDEVEKVKKQIRQFETLHLKKWAYTFFSRLEDEACIVPYSSIAQIAKVGLKQVL